ncbi:aldo/keto reductase [Streptomyces sp. NPDC050636]|uniref:aldo/keto reductase n=1 Tax=Streptomyces sp. NPDC050636 TaxID=3154510 RepID=UPI00341B22E8
MTTTPPAGTITIAGKSVSRLGFGTMRLTGPGIWGDPTDRDSAISVLRQVVHTYRITHIDTADAYGPHTVEHLVREALYPYPEHVLIAAKVGMLRPAPIVWAPHGHPAYRPVRRRHPGPCTRSPRPSALAAQTRQPRRSNPQHPSAAAPRTTRRRCGR